MFVRYLIVFPLKEADQAERQQAAKLGAAFLGGHAVGVQGVGAAVGFWIVHHDP